LAKRERHAAEAQIAGFAATRRSATISAFLLIVSQLLLTASLRVEIYLLIVSLLL
jgi:hypothetical protein